MAENPFEVIVALFDQTNTLRFCSIHREGAGPMYAVVENTCDQKFTYILNGTSVSDEELACYLWCAFSHMFISFMFKAIYLGPGDSHDTNFDDMQRTIEILVQDDLPEQFDDPVCTYRFQVYPTKELSDEYNTSLPVTMAIIVAATFFAMAVTFFMYDRFVRMRNAKVVHAAARLNRIVSSLFPSTVRDRVLALDEEDEIAQQPGTQTRLKKFLANDGPTMGDMETDDIMYKTRPIADLFPETSILFADIAGFTAWSSAREPSQVFTLLETVYKSFDE